MSKLAEKLIFWLFLVPLFYMLPAALTGYEIYRHSSEPKMYPLIALMAVISIILMTLFTVAITFQVYPKTREFAKIFSRKR